MPQEQEQKRSQRKAGGGEGGAEADAGQVQAAAKGEKLREEMDEILDEIGRGGMAQVFLAKDTRCDRTVALKVLAERWSSDVAITDRFVQEGLIMSQLEHPGIVKVLDVGRDQGRFYIVLEYVDGQPLRSILRRLGLPIAETTRLVAAVARNAARRNLTARFFEIGPGEGKFILRAIEGGSCQ